MKRALNDLRSLVILRCGNQCEKCGLALPESWALHHRKLRSRGGEDEISNVVALHHACHNLGTDSVHANPTQSDDNGLMVGSWQSPKEKPVILPSGGIVILNDEGTYTYLEGKPNGW